MLSYKVSLEQAVVVYENLNKHEHNVPIPDSRFKVYHYYGTTIRSHRNFNEVHFDLYNGSEEIARELKLIDEPKKPVSTDLSQWYSADNPQIRTCNC